MPPSASLSQPLVLGGGPISLAEERGSVYPGSSMLTGRSRLAPPRSIEPRRGRASRHLGLRGSKSQQAFQGLPELETVSRHGSALEAAPNAEALESLALKNLLCVAIHACGIRV